MARRIGLTGGIASGKSAAAAVMATLGAVVIDADLIAHQVTDPGGSVFEQVSQAFPQVVLETGWLDRRELARIVFSDPAARERLNAIVHPAVRQRMNALARDAESTGAAAIVMEIPLLVENHLEQHMDEVWLIEVSADTQVRRLMARSHLSEDQARARIATQMPNAEKRAYAQVVIENEGSLEQLAASIRETWKRRGLAQ
ncbi:MAG: dephospho-CoA kinase [Sulfobacillus sp.]